MAGSSRGSYIADTSLARRESGAAIHGRSDRTSNPSLERNSLARIRVEPRYISRIICYRDSICAPLLLHGFGTSVRVNGRTLEIDWRSEGRKESYRGQLPFDSVVVDPLTGSVSFEALRFLAVQDVPVTVLRWNGSVLSTIQPIRPSNGDLRIAQVGAYQDSDQRPRIAREFIREKVSKTVSLAEHLGKTLPVSPEPIRNGGGWSVGGIARPSS